MSSICVPNAYTTICTDIIYKMISGLETLNLPIYQDILIDSSVPNREPSYFAIFPIKYAASSYMLVQCTKDGKIIFWSVNMQSDNILTANYNTFNVIPGLLVNYRGKTVLKYKNASFELGYLVPLLDQLINTKKKILSLLHDDVKPFILFDSLLFIFKRTDKNSFYRFIFAGILSNSPVSNTTLRIYQKIDFDYSNGSLIGLLDKKPFMVFNRYGLQSVNLYPYVTNGDNDLLIVGGINNYLIKPEEENYKLNLWKIDYAFELQYQESFFKTDNDWGYTPLETMIIIPNSCGLINENNGPIFIMAFANEIDPEYVYLGTTNFLNSDNTIITFSLPIEYSDSTKENWNCYPKAKTNCKDKFEKNSLYYRLEKNKLIIYRPSFSVFLNENKAPISISDLYYNADFNNKYIKVIPNAYGTTSYNYSNLQYTKLYKNMNWYFEMNPYFSNSIDPSSKEMNGLAGAPFLINGGSLAGAPFLINGGSDCALGGGVNGSQNGSMKNNRIEKIEW